MFNIEHVFLEPASFTTDAITLWHLCVAQTELNFRYICANKKAKESSSTFSSYTFNAFVFLCLLGFGGLGPIIEGPIVGWIADAYGWAGPFYLMVGMSLLGSITMLKASRIDQSIKQAQFMGTIATETT